MILALGVADQLGAIEVHLAQMTRGVARGLVVEMWRPGMTALVARRDRDGPHAVTELDDRDEAVATGSVPALGPGVGARAERGERAPAGGRKRHRNARARIVERLDDVPGQALEAVDLPPRRLPGSEIGRELIDGLGQRLQHLPGDGALRATLAVEGVSPEDGERRGDRRRRP